MNEWHEVTLGELGTIFDGPHATPTRIEDGPYFLNISSLQSGRLELAESDHVSEDDFARWTRRVTPEQGDLLFSYETRLGDAALMPSGIRACLGRRMALLRPNRSIVEPRFLLYMYLSPQFQRTIEQHTIHGATVNRIPLKTMSSWNVAVPALHEQRAIAAVLGALDDKIAANIKLATTAEHLAIARASQYRPNAALGEVAVQSKSQVKPELVPEEVVHHYSLPAFDEGKWPESSAPESIKSSKFLVSEPSVLLSKLNPRFPRVWNVAEVAGAPMLASTEFIVLTSSHCSSSVLWALLSQPMFTAGLEGLVAGTSGSHQRVKPSDALAVKIADPRTIPVSEQQAIEGLALRADAARSESRRLAAARDRLLPALISGRLSVRDGGAAVDELQAGQFGASDRKEFAR